MLEIAIFAIIVKQGSDADLAIMEIALQNQPFIPFGMSEFSEWLDGELKRIGRGAALRLAALLRIDPSGVSKMRDGTRLPKAHEVPIIESFVNSKSPLSQPVITADSPAPAKAAQRTVELRGYAGAGAQAHFYNVGDGHLDILVAPEWADENTVAIEIKGNSIGPFDRWVAFFDRRQRPISPDLIHQLCVIGLDDDRVLVKVIRPGSRKGLYNLESAKGPTIKNVKIVWASKVLSIERDPPRL